MIVRLIKLLFTLLIMIYPKESTPYEREGHKEYDALLDSLMMKQENGRNVIERVILRIEDIVNYPSKILRQKAYEDYIKRLTLCDGFRDFEEKLRQYTGALNPDDYDLTTSYISSLLILEQLDSSLKDTGVKLSDKVHALDIGCGKDWPYAEALCGFLQNYDTEQPRKVILDGIDLLATKKGIAKFEKRIGDRDINQMQGDVLEMDTDIKYDFILIHRMLASPGHFKMFGLEPTNMDDMMKKCSEILTLYGIQVTIGYMSAGEYQHVVEHIPVNRRYAEFNYAVGLGDKDLNREFTPGVRRKYSYGICVSRKE